VIIAVILSIAALLGYINRTSIYSLFGSGSGSSSISDSGSAGDKKSIAIAPLEAVISDPVAVDVESGSTL
jgi:hypothetical protein